MGYLGLIAAVFAGWLGPLAPLSGVIEGLTTIGFLAFFAFLISSGAARTLAAKPRRNWGCPDVTVWLHSRIGLQFRPRWA